LYLHTQNIIHRDLKSLNILVDAQMRAKVSDFGLSKIKLTTASTTKGGGGTPHWMAPELFDEEANTYASDVYATGIVFWEIAARKLPYEGKNQMQIGRYVEKGNRETIPGGIPARFASLMQRCWAQRAGDRPLMSEVAKEMRTITSTGASGSTKEAAPAALDSGYAVFSR
jgi:serine/threonine protein kinase